VNKPKPHPDQFIDSVMAVLEALGLVILALAAGYFATYYASTLLEAARKPWEPSTGIRGAVALSCATIAVLSLVRAWKGCVK